MAEFTNLSSMKIAGSVETSYQGKLMGTFENEDALPIASPSLTGLTVYLEDVKQYRRCNGSDWSTVVGRIHTDDDIQAPATAVQNALNTAKTDLQNQITANDGDISTLQSDVSTAKSDIITLQGNITTINSDISTLKSGKADNSDLAGYVPTSRKINNKALTGDITLTAADVGAVTSTGSVASATKATQDGSGNVITTTYATKEDVAKDIASAVASVYRPKGTVSALPTSGMVDGDVYNLSVAKDGYPAGTNWLWHESKWDALAGITDLSDYALKSDVSAVDTSLTNHIDDTVKHITAEERTKWNQAVTDLGNIEIPNVSAYDTHIANGDIHVTAAQKTAWTGKQDAISVTAPITKSGNTIAHASSGVTANMYGSTTTVPKITVNATGHVTAVTSETIPIPTKVSELSDASSYVTTSGLSSTLSGYQAKGDYATNTALTNGLNSKQNTLTFDSTPTSGSTNPVTSGGVYSAINTINQSLSTLEGKVEN
ncbi:MAG: hypothetical protein IJ469_02555, partial [Candidatus Methanomethylophilaceae archaeon]|nr:hypothetical protein [Candidatus Methanomethylophilaceae archaeon]